jgi:hypothetical protein
MSRHGYNDDINQWQMIKWRGQVASAIRGRRGQLLLVALRDALDAMPERALIAGELVEENGDVCALGCLAKARGMDVSEVDPEDSDQVADVFGIAPQLAREIVYENDEGAWGETPEQRWERMRKWVGAHIKTA